ncbi:MAG: YgiT-type zinc finger protein [Chloroflexota bacterium]
MKSDRCEFCEGEMEQRRILARFRYRGQTIYVENVPAWVIKSDTPGPVFYRGLRKKEAFRIEN